VAKKSKEKVGGESETSDIAPVTEPPEKKKTEFGRPPSPEKFVGRVPMSTKQKSRSARRGPSKAKPSKESQTMDAKVKLKFKPTEKKKKRKEVTSFLAFALVVSYKWCYLAFCRRIDSSSLKHAPFA